MLHTKRDYLHISDQCSIDTSSTMKKKRSEKIKYYPYHPKLVGTVLQPTKIGQQENNSKKTTSKCTLLWRKNYFNKVIYLYTTIYDHKVRNIELKLEKCTHFFRILTQFCPKCIILYTCGDMPVWRNWNISYCPTQNQNPLINWFIFFKNTWSESYQFYNVTQFFKTCK